MMTIVSSIFRVLCFPHEGKVVTIDQLSYCMLDSRTNVSMNIPFVSGSMGAYDSVGVGMFKDSSLMGTFTLPPPFNPSNSTPICMISLGTIESQGGSSASRLVSSNVLDVNKDPWVVPHPSKVESFEKVCWLSTIEISYQAIQSTSTNANQNLHHDMEYDQFTLPIWVFM
jgi:hypothetical protein